MSRGGGLAGVLIFLATTASANAPPVEELLEWPAAMGILPRRRGGAMRGGAAESLGGGVAAAAVAFGACDGDSAPNRSSASVGGAVGPPSATVAERSLPLVVEGEAGAMATPASAPAVAVVCTGGCVATAAAAGAAAPVGGGKFVSPLFSMMPLRMPMPYCVSVRTSSMFVLSEEPISDGAHTIAMFLEFILFLSSSR